MKPIGRGHCLISPLNSRLNLLEMSKEELKDFSHLSQFVCKVAKRRFGCKGIYFAIQDGKSAGQSVSHLHKHILPCVERPPLSERRTISMEEMKEEAEEWKKAIQSFNHSLDSYNLTKEEIAHEILQQTGINKEVRSTRCFQPLQMLHSQKSVDIVLSNNPILLGHVLLFPKRNIKHFDHLNHEEVHDFNVAMFLVSKLLKQELKAEAVNSFMNDGANLEKDRFFVEMVPRNLYDLPQEDIYDYFERRKKPLNVLTEEEIQELVQRLKRPLLEIEKHFHST